MIKPDDLIQECEECSVRFRQCCKANDIRTFAELKKMIHTLPKLRNFGKHSITEAKELLHEIERNNK